MEGLQQGHGVICLTSLTKLPLAVGNRVQVAGLEARRLGGACMRVAGTESHGWGALFLPMSEVSVLGLGMTVLSAEDSARGSRGDAMARPGTAEW